MPGRGRGSFGTKFSFDLAALGFGGRFGLSQLTSAQAPPSAFPPLDAKPAQLIVDNEHEYLVEISRNFHSLVNDSPFYLRPLKPPKPLIEHYTDLIERTETGKDKHKSKKPIWPPVDKWPIDWERFPMELRPPSMRNAVSIDTSPTNKADNKEKSTPSAVTNAKKRPKKNAKDVEEEEGPIEKKKKRLRVKEEDVDDATIEKRLADLEQAEKQGDGMLPVSRIKQELVDIPEVEPVAEEGGDEEAQGEDEAKKKKAASDEEDNNEASDDDEEAHEEELDEEMGDYGDDYFDNGEAYDEEDDGDNEGPTY